MPGAERLETKLNGRSLIVYYWLEVADLGEIFWRHDIEIELVLDENKNIVSLSEGEMERLKDIIHEEVVWQ